jgi:hypothetical protein
VTCSPNNILSRSNAADTDCAERPLRKKQKIKNKKNLALKILASGF